MSSALPEVAHLLVPTWGADPALDRHSRALGAALRAAGVRSDLFAREHAPGHPAAGADGVRSTGSLQAGAAGPSDSALMIVRVTPEGWRDPIPGPGSAAVVLGCHRFFSPGSVAAWDPAAARRMAATVNELQDLRARTVLVMVDSEAAAHHMDLAGFHRTVVVPALEGSEQVAGPDVRTLRRLRHQHAASAATAWVTFGGVHPLSGIDRVIGALWAARRYLDLGAVLHVVGAVEDVQHARALRAVAVRLGVAPNVHMAGAVTPEQEAASLEAADLVCDLSPSGRSAAGARAALARRRPVVAVRGGTAHAVVDGAGLVVGAGAPMVTARCADRVHGDPAVRRLLAEAAGTRCAELDVARAGRARVELLASALVAA